ncbi:MAG TPA: AGE family epimerase/isomerase [Bryobacteraceae bacterium]|nr:AGE family epimerase/isomerase [Bryobacteraceae bacterium]
MNIAWAASLRSEVAGNILPFWAGAEDRQLGGFYGKIDCDGRIDAQAPRAAVIQARILWTFSAASRLIDPAYREISDRAAGYLLDQFWDTEHGGIYWMLDYLGRPLSDRKQIYAQAFAIYGLAEHFRATGSAQSLERARQLYQLIEAHSSDPVYGGYIEACARDWGALADMRLSEKDLNSPKSMNTHLHILEAYTNLLRVWRDGGLLSRQRELLEVTVDRIVDPRTAHFKLFFDMPWNSLTDHVSYGHDIEGSWLLVEAAEAVGDRALLDRVRQLAIRMAGAVAREAVDADGSIFYEADATGALIDPNKHWWAQSEAVVGFYNAYQLTGEKRFCDLSRRAWEFIESKMVDRAHGEWHAKLKPGGIPFREHEDSDACLVGPWKCPYHNSRVCYEMIERLKN